MKFTLSWLKEHLETTATVSETADKLVSLGLEVEGVEKFESLKGGLKGIVVGHVLTCEQHPDADRLKVTTVDLGDGNPPVQIVCGAPNLISK